LNYKSHRPSVNYAGISFHKITINPKQAPYSIAQSHFGNHHNIKQLLSFIILPDPYSLDNAYKKAPTTPATPISTLPAPTARSLAAPLFAVPVAAAELEVPVLLATLTAPLDPVVCPAPPVVDPVVGAEKAEDTGPEIAALVVVP
jgi:hypothetical protein